MTEDTKRTSDEDDDRRPLSPDAEAIIDAVPRAVHDQLKVQLDEMMGALSELQKQVTRKGAFVEAFVSLANGCVFRNSQRVSQQMAPIIELQNEESVKQIVPYDQATNRKLLVGLFATRVVNQTLYAFGDKVRMFKSWLRRTVRTVVATLCDTEVSGLAALYFVVGG